MPANPSRFIDGTSPPGEQRLRLLAHVAEPARRSAGASSPPSEPRNEDGAGNEDAAARRIVAALDWLAAE
jgi:hypothetical protein